MDPDAPSAVDADGFGGYTALYSSVVSQRGFWVNYGKGQPHEARFTRLLLERGANPNVRASLRARLEEGHGGGLVQRLPQRDTARVGRTIPRTHFREPRGGSVDRGERRRSMIVSEIRIQISDAVQRDVHLLASDRLMVNELWVGAVTPP
jgi:hypothetical protein